MSGQTRSGRELSRRAFLEGTGAVLGTTSTLSGTTWLLTPTTWYAANCPDPCTPGAPVFPTLS